MKETSRSHNEEKDSPKDMIKTILVLQVKDKVYKFDKDRIVLGSLISADLRLTGDGVSPIHAVLERTEDHQGVIFDLASDTGVFINQKKVVTQKLNSKDRIVIGRHDLIYSVEKHDPKKSRRAEKEITK